MRLREYRIPLEEFACLIHNGNKIRVEGGPPATAKFVRVSLLPGPVVSLVFEDASFPGDEEPSWDLDADVESRGTAQFVLEEKTIVEERQYRRALSVVEERGNGEEDV